MTNTNAHPVPAHWHVNRGHFLGSLKVTAAELGVLHSRMERFWSAPGGFSMTTSFDSPEDGEHGTVRVEYEGLDEVASRVFLVMLGFHDDINDDLIREPEPEIRQTSCRNCELEIEGTVGESDWQDRGGNIHCPSGERHVPA